MSTDYYKHEMYRIDHGSSDGCDCHPCKDRRRKSEGKTIQLAAEARAAGLNITPQQRIGHAHREQATTHIHEMLTGGFIDEEEAEKRLQYAESATTSMELASLTRDLPAPTDHRSPARRLHEDFDFSQKKWYVPILSVLTVLGLNISIIPSAVAGADHWWLTTHGLLLAWPTILGGAGMAVWAFCWLIHKTLD
jgi:hypothetical protein